MDGATALDPPLRGVGYGLEIPTEYRFYGNEKAIQWAKRTLDAVDGNMKKKFKMFTYAVK